MKSYQELKREYEILDEKYDNALGEKSELAYELAELKASADYVREQDDQIRRLHENMRRLKHDMKNHLMVIASYLNKENYDAAREYTSEILDKLNAVHSYIETGNTLLNHILNEKLSVAKQRGIAVKAEIENLPFEKMESLDFSAMLTNLLDNAIEACAMEEHPGLDIRISRRRGYETVLVKNRISDSVLAKNPGLNSTKQDKASHGMGILQIKAIADKYEGMCDFYEEDGWFCACTFIPI